MTDTLDPNVEAELAGLSGADAALVRPVLAWLLGGHGLDRLHQTGLQQFLWYELPFKWLGPVADRHHVVGALGRYFDQCGLARYGDICRSATTATVLDTWAGDSTGGFDAFHAAHLASGVVPPDTAGFQWGELMGPVELDAFWSTAQALELAVAVGVLEPGTARWRSVQRTFTDEHLDRPLADRLGESWRQAVAAERLSAWLDDDRGDPTDARSALLLPIAKRLLHEPALPRMAGRVARPMLWLAALAADRPVLLTAGGALPARVVRGACDELGWEATSTRFREADVGPLVEVRATAERVGLLRIDGSRLTIGARGRSVLDQAGRVQAGSVWQWLVADAARRTGLVGDLEELVDAVLLDASAPGSTPPPSDPPAAAPGPTAATTGVTTPTSIELAELVRVPLTERGWQVGAPGRPVADGVLQPALTSAIDRRAGLGLIATRRGRPREPIQLTDAGRAAAIAALRARATRPRRA